MDDFEALLNQIRDSSRSEVSAGGPGQPSNYDRFLETLRSGRHPAYCEVVWNGEAYHVVLQIHFQKVPQAMKPPGPEVEVYRREAYQRFRRIGPAEQRLVTIRVQIKNGAPVTAELTIRPEAAGVLRLGTDQLLDFQNP